MPKKDRVNSVRAENTGKVRAVTIEQGKPMNTKNERKSASKHVCYDAARYEAATRPTRPWMHEHKEVQLRGHHGEDST